MKTKSIVSESQYCLFCGNYATQEHHLLFGSNRQKAEQHGIKVPICANCHTTGMVVGRIHDNPMAEMLSKMLGQAIYEKEQALNGADREQCRQNFRSEFGISYL